MDSREQLDQKIREDIRSGKQVMLFNSVYGNAMTAAKAHAYVEEVIKPVEGGTFTKLYGCSYLFKGFPSNLIVDSMGAMKRVIAASVNLVIHNPFNVLLPILFLFFKKRAIKAVVYWLSDIYSSEMEQKMIPLKEYNQCAKELIRAGVKLTESIGDEEYRAKVQKLIHFFGSFMEFDNAYRVRFQDLLVDFNKHGMVRDEIGKLFNLLMERDFKLKGKAQKVKKVIMFLLRFRSISDPLDKFFMELDMDKVLPDEADYYFSLGQGTYNVGGISLEDRVKMKDQIDAEKGHIIFSL